MRAFQTAGRSPFRSHELSFAVITRRLHTVGEGACPRRRALCTLWSTKPLSGFCGCVWSGLSFHSAQEVETVLLSAGSGVWGED